MDVKTSLLKLIRDDIPLSTCEEIARKLRLGKQEMRGIFGLLSSLVKEGKLLVDSRGRYGTAAAFGAMEGTICGNERGFAFFTPEDGGESLFLPRQSLKDALHGDRVLAFRTDASGNRGEVLAVLSRGMERLSGTFYRNARGGSVVADERRFSEEIFIPAVKTKYCSTGQKVIVRILSHEGRVSGEIEEVLGESGDLFAEELAVIRSHDLALKFPAEVEAEAVAAAARPLCGKGREDLRSLFVVTVDGEDTRDIDDAVSLTKEGAFYKLGVHIADVSGYVTSGSKLDAEAFRRGTSVYFPDRVLPMLPTALSNGACSLNEGEDRYALSCLMTVDESGTVVEKRIVPSLIRSRHRLTYTEVQAWFDGAPCKDGELAAFLSLAAPLTLLLKRVRTERGGVALDIKESKILFRDGRIEIPVSVRTLAHEMIEQFMVLANESVASYSEEHDLPCLYRIHERPTEEKASDFADFLKGIGITPRYDPSHVTPKDYLAIIRRTDGTPLASTVSRVMLRSMMKARYFPENRGHFGLASDCYCHFTSPIRRYPDLVVHRILKMHLQKPEKKIDYPLDRAAESCSNAEKNAAETERDVDALYMCAYMENKLGMSFPAAISGVTSFGLFAELRNGIEGFIPLDALPDDWYEYDEGKLLLRGMQHTYRLGLETQITVTGIDYGSRRVIMTLSEKGDKA